MKNKISCLDEEVNRSSDLEQDCASLNRTLTLHRQEIKDLKRELSALPAELDHSREHQIKITKLESTIGQSLSS